MSLAERLAAIATRDLDDRTISPGDAHDLLDIIEGQVASTADARTRWLLELVGVELTKAMQKFAPFNSPHEGKAVIEEELDELWAHVKANTGQSADAIDEAIQIAAMALRYAYDLAGWGPRG